MHLALVVPTFAMDWLGDASLWPLQRKSNIHCVSLTHNAFLLRFGNASCVLGSFVLFGGLANHSNCAGLCNQRRAPIDFPSDPFSFVTMDHCRLGLG